MNDDKPETVYPTAPRRMPTWLKVILWLFVGVLATPVLVFGTCLLLYR